jgi:hypothetical protein
MRSPLKRKRAKASTKPHTANERVAILQDCGLDPDEPGLPRRRGRERVDQDRSAVRPEALSEVSARRLSVTEPDFWSAAPLRRTPAHGHTARVETRPRLARDDALVPGVRPLGHHLSPPVGESFDEPFGDELGDRPAHS